MKQLFDVIPDGNNEAFYEFINALNICGINTKEIFKGKQYQKFIRFI